MAKPKAETSKSDKREGSPNKNSKTEPSSSSRTSRRSPARSEKPKSPSRAANKSPTPSGRPSTRSSPGRTSPARKSPGRKSPGRKSPTRKPPSPGRRSPGRSHKVVEKSEAEKPKSPGRTRKQVIEIDSDSDNAELNRLTNIEKPKAAVRGRARRLDSDYTSPKVILHDIQTLTEVPPVEREISNYIGLVRRSVHKSASREVDRIVHLKHNDAGVKKLTEFSDEDDVPVLRSSSVREKSERYSEPKVLEERLPKTEFGGWIGALMAIFTTPLTIISLSAFCNEKQCSFTKLPDIQTYKNISTFVDTKSFLAFSGFALFLAILSALPFGGPKVSGLPNKQGKLNYVLNGLFATVVTSVVVVTLEFLKVPVAKFIVEKYFQLLISSLIVGVLFSIYLYVRSFFVSISALNPHAISKSRIYNFWVGRELNPRPLRVLDTKLFLLKISVIGVILLNAAYVYNDVKLIKTAEQRSTFDLKSLNYNPTLLIIAALQTFYALDIIYFENNFLSSFEIQHEGVGYMSCILGFPAPFLPVLITKYVYEHKVQLPVWQLAAAVLVFSIGYFLYRLSNRQKHAFRQNPYSPALAHLESIPTSQGKKLLVSGYWGFVRHPNYLGDILIWSSFALFAWNVPPAAICYGDFLFLIYRAHRDGSRCKQRYGNAWDRYCQRVKYVLIPKVY